MTAMIFFFLLLLLLLNKIEAMLTHTRYQKIWACFSWCKTEILKYQFRKIHKGLFFSLPNLIFIWVSCLQSRWYLWGEMKTGIIFFSLFFLPGTTLEINLKIGPFREDLFQEISVLILQRWLAQLLFHIVLLIFPSPQLDKLLSSF